MKQKRIQPIMLLFSLLLVFGNTFVIFPDETFAEISDSNATVSISVVDSDDKPMFEQMDIDLSQASTVSTAIHHAATKADVELDEDANWRYTVNGELTHKEPNQYYLDRSDVVQVKPQTSQEDFNPEKQEGSTQTDSQDSDKTESKDSNETKDLEPSNPNENGNYEQKDSKPDKREEKTQESTEPSHHSKSNENENTEQTQTSKDDNLEKKKQTDDAEESELSSVEVNSADVKSPIGDLLKYVDENVKLEYGSEWWIWGLAHTDYSIHSGYVDSIKKEVKDSDGEFRGLELHKIVISLTLLGEDVTDFVGYNLIDLLSEQSNYGVNAYSYSLLAFDSGDYEAPEGYRNALIEDILKAEKKNGGWAFFGDDPTIDITAMVLAALTPYQDNPDVKAATDRAVTYLSEEQRENGGFNEAFIGGDTSESVSQVIVGITALGIDPNGKAFTKEGGNLFDHLREFRLDDGSYAHVVDDEYALPMSTEQAFLAHVSYDKYLKGTGSVYQAAADEDEKPNESDEDKEPGTPADPGNPKDASEPDDGPGTPEDPLPEEPTNPSTNLGGAGNLSEHVIEREQNGAKKYQKPKVMKNPSETDVNKESVSPQSDQDNEKSKNKEEETLPTTATSLFNYLASGLLFVMTGAVLIIIRKRIPFKHRTSR